MLFYHQFLKVEFLVKSTEAEKVYVTHGSTEIFSKYLNEIGIASEVVKTKFGEEEEQGDDNIEPGSTEENSNSEL